MSKNLLEMKFMKRTKEKTEKIEEEEVRSRMFDGEVSGAMRDGASRIVVEPSYVNIENLRFGRLAFKGMNSEIESLMAEHAAAMAEDKTNETDVNDVEMANRLSKTIAKKFATKRDNSGKPAMNKVPHTADTASLLANTSSFLAQVRAETDMNKKSKPHFLKPPTD